MRGVPLKVIQELLGHSSIVTTMRYAHLAPHVAREAVRVLDRPRPPAVAPNSAPKSSPPPGDPRQSGEGLAKIAQEGCNQLRS